MTYQETIICGTCKGEGIHEYIEVKHLKGYLYTTPTTVDKCPTCEGSGLLEVFHKPKKLPFEGKKE